MANGVPLLALDLSLTATGMAIVDPDGAVELRTLTSKVRGVDRLCDLVDAVMLVTMEHVPVIAVIEDLVHMARGASAGPLGMLHGAVRVALRREGCDEALVPPASLKKYATGKGNATKPDMRMALYKRVGLDLRDDNQVDAWWLAAAARDQYGAPLVGLPEVQRAALAKVEWPDLESAPLAEGWQ